MTIVKFQRETTTKLYNKRYYLFYENILKDFQVTERTRNDHYQISKLNNYRTV